jgi:membrane fusion protein (multidrug efflux system)
VNARRRRSSPPLFVDAVVVALLAAVAACPKSAGEAPDEGAKPSALVAVEPARTGAVEETIAAYGVVEPAASATEPVVADLDGTVIKVWVRPGQMLKRGDAVADVRDSKAVRLDATKAKISVDFAEQALARVTDLRGKGLATNADVAQAQAELEKARAEAGALGGTGGTRTVRAPSAGLVNSVVVKPGDAVAAGGPLVVLSGTNGERIRLGIEAADLARVAVGAKVHVQPLHGGDVVDGVVGEVHPQIEAETHQASVSVSLPGQPIVTGAMCRGDVVVRSVADAIVVPRKSVVDGAVFVVDGDKAKRVPVELVVDDGVHAAVKGALADGALVVTTGAAELEDGMAVRTAGGAK